MCRLLLKWLSMATYGIVRIGLKVWIGHLALKYKVAATTIRTEGSTGCLRISGIKSCVLSAIHLESYGFIHRRFDHTINTLQPSYGPCL